MLDIRTAQTQLENLLRDTILQALGTRIAQQASIAALRAFGSVGAGGSIAHTDDTLVTVAGSPVLAFRWSSESTAADNGTTVIKPTDAGANGRWIAWVTPLRFSLTVAGDSVTLDQITSGPLRRVIVLDQNMTNDDVKVLLAGEVPAVIIEATDDNPSEATFATGRWLTEYEFTITVVAENLRNRREAAQGSLVPGETVPGANALDGFIKALLCGVQLSAVESGIRNTHIGRGHNWKSELGQRRVMRARAYTLQVTEQFPNAPNETQRQTEVDVQANTATLDQAKDTADPANYLKAGMAVAPAGGLTQPISAGSALIGGALVNFAGSTPTFTAYSDTYRDLLPNGTLTLIVVANGAPVPALTPTALRIGVTITNGISVTDDVIIAATQTAYGPRFVFPL
jgi:hypothetical protein